MAEMGFVQAAASISLAWSSGLHSKWEFFASTGVNKDGEERRLLLQLKAHVFKREINTRFQLLLSKKDFKTLGCPFVLSKLSSGMQFQVEKLRTLLRTVELMSNFCPAVFSLTTCKSDRFLSGHPNAERLQLQRKYYRATLHTRI